MSIRGLNQDWRLIGGRALRVLCKDDAEVAFFAMAHSSVAVSRDNCGWCPRTADSGHRNLLKPTSENQALTTGRTERFLGNGFVPTKGTGGILS
jgi:hypothetical protein